VHQRTCVNCSTAFTAPHGNQKYCSETCRTCSEEGCDRPIQTKGLCGMHYKRTRPRTPDKPQTVGCAWCGATVTRSPRKRVLGATCSYECRRLLTFGWSEPLHDDHWGRWYGATSTWTPPQPRELPARFTTGQCADCGEWFTADTNGSPIRYCGEACARRVAKRRRRAREHDAPGDFRYTDVIRQYLRQGKTCAYCHKPCRGLPDPEHVVALSRGGSNSMTNIVAACRLCNADKRDLMLSEWAEDRARRGLNPVDVTLSGPAFKHLTVA
jgi:hypothetical protein